MLFFLWSGRILTDHYMAEHPIELTLSLEYWIHLLCILAGIFITLFVLSLLLQRKFSYIVQISRLVEAMESGNLSLQIPEEGEDELTDLAVSINHLSRAWEQQLEETDQMNQARFETMTALSHDLRTPLTSVMSYLQLIQEHQYQDETQLALYAGRAYEKALRIKEMSSRLMDSCRPAGFDGAAGSAVSGRVAPDSSSDSTSLERTDGAIYLHHALREAASQLEDSEFQIQLTEIPSNCCFYLLLDSNRMSRLWDNLLSNIEKYADPKFPVELETKLSAPYLVLRQSNHILDTHQHKDVESHLIGLKSVEQGLLEMHGSLQVTEEDGIFTVEIRLPLC